MLDSSCQFCVLHICCLFMRCTESPKDFQLFDISVRSNGNNSVLCFFRGKAEKFSHSRVEEHWPKVELQGRDRKNTLSAPINVLFCRGDNPNTWQSINHNPDRKTCNNRKQRVWFGMVSRSITRKIRARKFNPTSVESVGSVKNHNMCLSQCAAENHDKSKHPLPSWNHLKPPAPPHSIRNVPHCGTNDNYIWPKLRRGCHRFELSSLILMDTA